MGRHRLPRGAEGSSAIAKRPEGWALAEELFNKNGDVHRFLGVYFLR